MTIKMIVSDMDGTLLNKDLKITQESANIIKAVQEKGIIFTIASGRSHYMMNNYYNDLGMFQYQNGYMIGLNGIELYSFKDNKLNKYESLTYQKCINISKSILELSLIPILMYDQETVIIQDYHEKEASRLLEILNNIYHGAFINVKLKFLKDIDKNEIMNKFCILNNRKNVKMNVKRLKQKINDDDIDVFEVGNEWIEIMPSNINKANRIQEIMQKENISKDEILVFGDSQNDIKMLELIPNSYAMANATDEVKGYAHYIADSHERDGVAKIIKKRLF